MKGQVSVPVGSQVLGRVINSHGEPVDGKGAFSGAQCPSLDFGVLTGQQQPQQDVALYETGIKVVDLLAPIPYGGTVCVFGVPQVGTMVLAEELMCHLIRRSHGYVIGVAMCEATYEVSPLMDTIREANLQDHTVLVFEPVSHDVKVGKRMVQSALAIARQFRAEGHEVLLVTDLHPAAHDALLHVGELKQCVASLGITTLMLRFGEDVIQQITSDLAPQVSDTRIVMSRELAKHHLWPAVDRLLSTSRLLESSAVSEEHKQVALQVRSLLTRYPQTQEVSASSLADQRLSKRARLIQQFLTQPFYVAEPFTEIPGEYLTIAETVSGFKALLDGMYDDLPEKACSFVGSIDQAVAKSKSLQ